jgi:hypothetical protein
MVYKSNTSQTQSSRTPNTSQFSTVRILDIILDLSHPLALEYGGYDAIGTISFAYLDENTPLEIPWINGNIAVPLFSFIKKYPLINELTLIASTYDKNMYADNGRTNYYFPDLNIWNHPHHNALPTMMGNSDEQTIRDYQRTESGISRQVTDGATDIPLGKYFQEQLNIKPLLPYEGDTIFEGRFGNTIRLGSTSKEKILNKQVIPTENKNRWSNEGTTGDPIIIIRNGQTKETDDKGWQHITEDIDFDDSSIYLTSNQQITDFIPASDKVQSYYSNPTFPL